MQKNCKDNELCECKKEIEKTPTRFILEEDAVLTRSQIYDMIEGEREYQKNKWRHYEDSAWSINDWVVFIKRYLKEINNWTGHPREQMDAMRKVAALAIACMEFNGSRPREVNGVKE
jgi:hypothetical protein